MPSFVPCSSHNKGHYVQHSVLRITSIQNPTGLAWGNELAYLNIGNGVEHLDGKLLGISSFAGSLMPSPVYLRGNGDSMSHWQQCPQLGSRNKLSSWSPLFSKMLITLLKHLSQKGKCLQSMISDQSVRVPHMPPCVWFNIVCISGLSAM